MPPKKKSSPRRHFVVVSFDKHVLRGSLRSDIEQRVRDLVGLTTAPIAWAPSLQKTPRLRFLDREEGCFLYEGPLTPLRLLRSDLFKLIGEDLQPAVAFQTCKMLARRSGRRFVLNEGARRKRV